MASFWAATAARTSFAAATKHASTGGLLFGTAAAAATATTTVGVAASSTSSECESSTSSDQLRQRHDRKHAEAKAKLRTRMTSVGHFSFASQTDNNPSVSSFFMTMVGDKPGFTTNDFHQLWKERGMAERHPRFHYSISSEAPGHFEPEADGIDHVQETFFPHLYRKDIQSRMEALQTQPLDVHQKTWEVQIASSGPLGQSGGVPSSASNATTSPAALSNQVESVLFFRGHHALGDGVSMFTAILDLCDEAEEFRETIKRELKKRFRGRRPNDTLSDQLIRQLKKFFLFWIGCLQALLYQGQLHLLSLLESNPLKQLERWALEEQEEAGDTNSSHPKRTISFSMAAPVDEIKWVAQTLVGKKATINDVFVSCVSAAIVKQLEEHRQRVSVLEDVANDQAEGEDDSAAANKKRRPRELGRMSHMNIVMPVHLYGGVMLPGQSLGNRIGAMVARVPGEAPQQQQQGDDDDDTMLMLDSSKRLEMVHETLYQLKQTPTPLLSYLLVRLTSSVSGTFLPNSWTQFLFSKANANAAAVVTNVRGPPKPLHVKGRLVQSVHGFVPLPPGIPIGVVVSSYAGQVKLSLSAEPWAVPDGDQFLLNVLEEYQSLLEHAKRKAAAEASATTIGA